MTFKPGDRVVFNQNYGKAVKGDPGTVTRVYEDILTIDVDGKCQHSACAFRVDLLDPLEALKAEIAARRAKTIAYARLLGRLETALGEAEQVSARVQQYTDELTSFKFD